MNSIFRYPRIFILSFLPIDQGTDKVSTPKSAIQFQNRDPSIETGWDRIQRMFKIDEFGGISSEINSIYQAGFLGFLTGAVYGGVIHSRNAYVNFMENNEATKFKSHLDAKRKLQDEFTINFAKGAFKWGWRVALFTSSYVAIITLISVYREKSSIYEYLAAGTTTGALYKINLGLRGMAVGGLVGGVLGGVGGAASLLILKASGTSMEEVRYWQYKWKLQRENVEREARKVALEEESELGKAHDEKVGTDIKLENIK